MIHANVIVPAFGDDGKGRAPIGGVRLVSNVAALRQLAGYLVAIGPLPAHAPLSARR